jgi:uncharacterized delta-60 repeat protein
MVALCAPSLAGAGAGVLDPSFGSAGVTVTRRPSSHEWVADAVQQPDGYVVVAGTQRIPPSAATDLVVARYDPSGQLDATFGSGGFVTTDVAFDDRAAALLRQPDGKLVVVGTATPSFDDEVFALVRYEDDGSLDAGFGSGGVTTTAIGARAFGRGVVRQSSGKLVVAGYTFEPGPTGIRFALARYDVNGTLDTNFGTGGVVTTDLDEDRPVSVLVQPDDKLVVAGEGHLVRYEAEGVLDVSFGTGGVVATPSALACSGAARPMLLQPDGKILLAGGTVGGGPSCSPDFVVVRFGSDGSPDAGFGSGGVAVSATADTDEIPGGLALQPDGKVLVAGWEFVSGGSRSFTVARFDADGTLDATFGAGGMVDNSFRGAQEVFSPVLLLADGRFVVASSVRAADDDPAGTDVDFSLWRYFGDAGGDRPLDGKTLVLVRTASGSERLTFVSRDPTFLFPIPGGLDDPTSGTPGGAIIELFSGNDPAGATMTASPGTGTPGWRFRATGRRLYKFVNPAAPAGPTAIKVLTLKEGKVVKLVARSVGLALAGPQGSVGIRITTGTLRNCALFDVASIRRDQAGLFRATNALAASLVDCSDASLGN